jgi:lambda repressor-like predicted transcriptional regulator
VAERVTRRGTPRSLVGDAWPDGVAPDRSTEVAQTVARRLRDRLAKDHRSVRSVAVAAGVTHQTVRNVLNGDVWADIRTLTALEGVLDMSLWPHRRAKRTES